MAKNANIVSLHNPSKTEKLAKQLGVLLADTYMLYLKTQNFHWNVTGPHFSSLHAMFMQQYTDLSLAIDDAAERIRSLGHYAPGSMTAYSKLANIADAPSNPPSAMEMVKILAKDHKTIIASCKKVLDLADDLDDEPTEDYAVQRLTVYEKNAWMLNSILG